MLVCPEPDVLSRVGKFIGKNHQRLLECVHTTYRLQVIFFRIVSVTFVPTTWYGRQKAWVEGPVALISGGTCLETRLRDASTRFRRMIINKAKWSRVEMVLGHASWPVTGSLFSGPRSFFFWRLV